MLRIVTVAYKNFSMIERLKESIEKHVTAPYELIIWDNSKPALSELQKLKTSNCFIVQAEKNIGFARAVNEACKHPTKSNWTDLLLINPDAIFASEFSMSILRQLRSLNGICGLRVFNDQEKTSRQSNARTFPTLLTSIAGREGILTRIFPNNRSSRDYLRKDLTSTGQATEVNWVSGCALFCTREIWAILNGFDSRYFLYVEDVDLGRKAKAQGIRVYYAPFVDVIHESRGTAGENSTRADYLHHRGMLLYFWKWSSPFEKIFIPIITFGIALRFIFRSLLGSKGRLRT